MPCYLGGEDAGTSLGNPDNRVTYRPKGEDGLDEGRNTDDGEDAEATRREEKEEHTEDGERKANNDDSRNGNRVVPTEAADQRETEENGDTRADCHAPGGTWLTKVRSFLKDSILKRKTGELRQEGRVRDGTGGRKREARRERGGDEGE
ncbi:hypothetical protein NDU88_007599 [Pleurodeles waltl]|uniref:Uncharacterized protein n=1 Tax=Pleurodeles waltl TaxID=8319 RepID=A0AAV7P1A5_PLEWA|nr:hypothetical protein NDU88_007599 [Pleurodeles waltl]